MRWSIRTYIIVLSPLLLACPEIVAADKPLKVFILAGQSNMQGHANVSTFESLADDPKTAPLLKEMLGRDGKPKASDKVWISSVGCQGDAYSDLKEQSGKLTVGYGAFGVKGNRIGPEYLFGLTMEKALNEPILIIKTSWGGRSLHTDFRPPSAGPFVWSEAELDRRKKRGDDVEKLRAEKEKATGVYYREMMKHAKQILADIKRVVPDHDPTRGYELAGFVWFQGFNDYVDSGVYPKQREAGGYDLYADLLAHFIRDVRKDFAAPNMPFVIGVMGIDGIEKGKKPPMSNFREAQRKPASLSEFKHNVKIVETAPFWDDGLDALQERMQRLNGKLDAEFKKDTTLTREAKEVLRKKAVDEQFKPEELKLIKSGVSNGGYHYLGAAKILAPIGKSFAEALLPKDNPPR
jgi:hypothetical protein